MNAPVIPIHEDDGRRTVVDMLDANTVGLLAGGLMMAMVVILFLGVLALLGAYAKDVK